MLSMCGLLCRMLRGWRHSEAVMLMAKALTQSHSSLLVQDIKTSDAGGVTVNEPCGTSLFCQNSNEGTLGQQLWRDNNKQAVIISPKQCVDLQRWTLFFSSSDNPSSPSCKRPLQSANENGTSSSGHPESSGTITVLLEATYRDTDHEPAVDFHVMVEHLSQPYAWKARDVFGVIVTTTPPQLLAMIQAFFNNVLLIDDDFLIKKILTIDVIGKPASMEDPLSIPQCITPGPWNADRMSLTQMEVARSVSPISTQGQPAGGGCGDAGSRGNSLHPPLLASLMRHQSSGESATDTSTTINPQSSTDSDKHPSSLDPQSSYDSVSDYPTSDADDVPCNVYNFYPRGWAVSGNQIISGQPLSVRGVLTQLEVKHQRKPCSIVTNPLEDLWHESEDTQRALRDSCADEQSILCLNGSSQGLEGRSTLPRVKKVGKGCVYPYRCIQGSVLCRRLEQAEPGRREREIVKEAAEYYQRALNSAHERKEWAKKSISSASDEDTPLNEYSFSGIQDEAVVIHEPKKYPVRIKSEADLSRATSIIKDNLANIVQRYLVKSGNSSECQYFYPKIPSENPNLKLLSATGESQDLVISKWVKRVDRCSAPAQAVDDVHHVDITVDLLRNSDQYDPIIVMENIRQVDHNYVRTNGRTEERLVEDNQNVDNTQPSDESDVDQLQILPTLTNQCSTRRTEQNPEIWISSERTAKNICAAKCKQPVRSTGSREKKLVKSEEIVPPTMKRESRIDIPINIEDELKNVTLFDQEVAKVKASVIGQSLQNITLSITEMPVEASATGKIHITNIAKGKSEDTLGSLSTEDSSCDKIQDKTDGQFKLNIVKVPVKWDGKVIDGAETVQRIQNDMVVHAADTPLSEQHSNEPIAGHLEHSNVLDAQKNGVSKIVTTEKIFSDRHEDGGVIDEGLYFDTAPVMKEVQINKSAERSIHREPAGKTTLIHEISLLSTHSDESAGKSIHTDEQARKSIHDEPAGENIHIDGLRGKSIHVDKRVGDSMHIDEIAEVSINIVEPGGKTKHVDKPARDSIHTDKPAGEIIHIDKPAEEIDKPAEETIPIDKSAGEILNDVDITFDHVDTLNNSAILQGNEINSSTVAELASSEIYRESSKVSNEKFADIPIIFGMMLSTDHPQESEKCDTSLHYDNLGTSDVVILESTEVDEESSDTNDDTMRLTQRPKCLKDIHKLNTKSSTASESSFESLPYRMLTSQPESLTDDIAIELTRAPPDSEKLKAARLELIRQERINAISLHSMSLMESRDDFRCKSVSPEEESKSDGVLIDPVLGTTHMYNEERQLDTHSNSMFDSGVEIMVQEQTNIVASSLVKSFPSPVESVPESGFSSLKEPLALEGTVDEGGFDVHTGVSLSKSKDSLDLTDTDRFLGTDTLSDDMETLSLSAADVTLVESGPVSTEGSARGSISDSLHPDSTLLKYYSSEPSSLNVNSVSFPVPVETSSKYVFCDEHHQHLSVSDLSHISHTLDSLPPKSLLEQFYESQEDAHTSKGTDEVSPYILKSNLTMRLDEKSIKCLSNEGNGSKFQTSESLSSEETVISKRSLEDQISKFPSQESQEEPSEFSEPPARLSNNVIESEINRENVVDITVETYANITEAVHSVAENELQNMGAVDKIQDYRDASAVISDGHHLACLPDKVLNEFEKEKYLKKADDEINAVKEPGPELNGSFSARETNTEENVKVVTDVECEFTKTDEFIQAGPIQNNTELHLSIADKLKLLNNCEPLVGSIREESHTLLKNSDNVINGTFSLQSVKSNEAELNSIEGSVALPHNKEVKGGETSSNTDVIVSVTSDTSKKSDSEKSSPNANETCSTGTSDRPSRNSSKSGISDLEDEVFLPPRENYIFDGRPVIYCPKIDMANQIGISPPKVAMSVFAVVPSKDTNIGKGAAWIAANKEELSKFHTYSVMPKLASNVNTGEETITDKSVTQPNETTFQDDSSSVREEEVQLTEEGMKQYEVSVDILNLINEKNKQSLSLESTQQRAGEREHCNLMHSTQISRVKIMNENNVASPEIRTDHQNVGDAEVQQRKNVVEGWSQNLIQSEFESSDARLAMPVTTSTPAVMKGTKREEDYHSSLDKVDSNEYRSRRDLQKDESEVKREEIASIDTHSALQTEEDGSLRSCDKIHKYIVSLSENRELFSKYVAEYSDKLSPKDMGEHIKPRLLRMPNLERTDTTASPPHHMSLKSKSSDNSDNTPQESPIVSPAMNFDKKKDTFSVPGLSVDAYSSSSPVSVEATDEENSVIENTSNIELTNTMKLDEETNACPKVPEPCVESIHSTGEYTPQDSVSSEENVIICGKSQKEELMKVLTGSEPELKKFGSEESSLLTLDSHGSSSSKGYLEPDLRSISSSWGASGSLECLDRDKSEKGSHTHRHWSITTAKSEELAMKCDKVSLKSQGSLDKFPHFDQVSSQQKARGARKKIQSVDIEQTEKKDLNKEMHRSVTLPAGSMVPSKKDEKKKEKEEKTKKKKKDKEGIGNSEKKSAMLSLKGLLKRNKSKEKEKEKEKDSSQEKLSSPSLFRKLERKNKSNSLSPRLDEKRHGEQGNVGNASRRDVENTKHSPVATNGKTRPVISGPLSMHQVGNMAGMGVATTICRGSGGLTASGSDSDSPIGSRQSSPKRIISHPRMASLGTQPSPRLYKHVLTRHLSSSQESIDNPLLSSTHSSPQTSPHTSPKRVVIPASASSYSLPASRDMSPPAPVMGTRALRGSSNSFSVTIGFKPKVEKRNRTMSEGADLNKVSLSPVSKRKEGSRILTQLNKRSSSMEILVCGKIREHCSQNGKSPGGSPFSREGSFRLHREISVETLFELPETSPRSNRTQEEYQEYLNEIHARNDSQHGSSWSLVEDSEMEKVYADAANRRSSHHTSAGKKLSLPHNMHLSGLCETASSNSNLQRTGSPFVRGVPHSSSFTSSPFRRPHSSAAVFSPAKRVMSARRMMIMAGGSPSSEATPGAPLMRVEEEGPCRKNLDSATEKPPNVLVYAANKTEYFTAVKETLLNCLNVDRYTVYQLTDEMAFKSPWAGSTTLLVVCGDVPAHVSTVFIR
nr:LOW QUALITY PROTEIN: uncharacterized protein LOC128687537 [Cherax quadricarinatus]